MNISDIWLQNQLAKQQQQGAQQSPSSQNPALMAALQQSLPQRGNPIDSGAMSAMGAARKSEEGKGFGSRLMDALGRTVSNYSVSKLRTSPSEQARMMGGMMSTWDEQDAAARQQEGQRITQNLQMMKYLSKEAQVQNEMRYKYDTLEEKRRYNNFRIGEKKGKNVASSMPGFDLSEYPEIKSTKERNDYATTLKGSNMAYNALGNIKKDFEKFKHVTKDNVFSPTGSMVPGINKLKDIAARAGVNKGINEEVVLRKRLESQFARLEPVLEKGLKGSAAGEQLLKRFHELGVYFNTGQPINIIEDRLEELLHEVGQTRDLAKWSLKTGRHIDALPQDNRESGEELATQALDKSTPSPQEKSSIIPAVKSVNPGLSDAAILEAERRLNGG